MTITYDVPSNTITIDNEASDFQDIADADIAGEWDVFAACGGGENKSYVSNAKIALANTASLTETAKFIVFTSICVSGNSQILFDVPSGCSLIFDHVSVLFNNPAGRTFTRIIRGGGIVYLYFSSIKSIPPYPLSTQCAILRDLGSTSRIWNCILDTCAPFASSPDIYRLTVINSYQGMGTVSSTNVDDVLLDGNKYNIYARTNYERTVKNVVARNPETKQLQAFQLNNNFNLVNPDFDEWTISWGDSTGKFVIKYEFDAACINKNGGTLEGVLAVGEYTSPYGQAFSVSTDQYGKIATQTIEHGFFDMAHGETEQLKTPLKVTYSKPGYQTVVKYYPMDQKTVDRVVMHKAVRVFVDLGRPAINLKKTDPENKKVMAL